MNSAAISARRNAERSRVKHHPMQQRAMVVGRMLCCVGAVLLAHAHGHLVGLQQRAAPHS
jgi:hypothetical protein